MRIYWQKPEKKMRNGPLTGAIARRAQLSLAEGDEGKVAILFVLVVPVFFKHASSYRRHGSST